MYSNEPIVKKKKVAAMQVVIGGPITVLGGLIAIGLTMNGSGAGIGLIIVLYVLTAIGLKILHLGAKNRKLINNFKAYIEILPEQSVCPLSQISSELGYSIELVKINLQKMIDKNVFVDDLSGAYIDKNKNNLVFPNFPEVTSTYKKTESENNNTEEDYNIINCPNCGGINKVRNNLVQECEYCGTLIS